jgi:hypothetical protein
MAYVAVAPVLRAGVLCRPLASLCMRSRAASLLLTAPRRAHTLAPSGTSVTVRAAAAAERAQQLAPDTFRQLGVSGELQVRVLDASHLLQASLARVGAARAAAANTGGWLSTAHASACCQPSPPPTTAPAPTHLLLLLLLLPAGCAG